MPENASLSGSIDQIDLEFTEHDMTPQFLMMLGIQSHLAGLSLSNTVSVLEICGVKRARSTVHNWVHEADSQPENGHNPDHVAVDETVIGLNNEQYWPYTAVDSETNELLHTALEPTRTNIISCGFSIQPRENTTFTASGELPAVLVCSQDVSCERCLSHRWHTTTERRLLSVRPRFQVRTSWKSEQRRTCPSRGKTTDY